MGRSDRFVAGVVVAVIVAVVGIIIFLTGMTWSKTDGGHYAVVRNGGPFDNNKIRDVLQPSSGRHWEGMYSQEHHYPASQRYYTISADTSRGDRAGIDVFQGSTADGVNKLGIEGTVQFTLVGDNRTLRTFDNKFGTRSYPVTGTDKTTHAWAGDNGWSAFLDAVFRPVLDNALRVEIQKFNCAELQPACGLVKGNKGDINGAKANQNLQQIQDQISSELQSDLDSTLGGHFLTVGNFRIQKVDLPGPIADAVDSANAAKVKIAQKRYEAQQTVAIAQGQADAATLKARAAERLAKAYRANPVQGLIEVVKNLPAGSQPIIELGGGHGINLNLGK